MEEVIRKYFQCWLDKDIDAVKEIFSDDIIGLSVKTDSLFCP